MRRARGAGKHRHEGGAGAKDHVRLERAAVHGLGIGHDRDIGTDLARGGDGRDAKALEQGRADLDDIGDAAQRGQDAKVFGLVQRDLQQHFQASLQD